MQTTITANPKMSPLKKPDTRAHMGLQFNICTTGVGQGYLDNVPGLTSRR